MNYIKSYSVVVKISLMLLITPTASLALTWDDGSGGATHSYYSVAAKLPWDRKKGDWRDIKDVAWGEQPFEMVTVKQGTKRVVFDVKNLVSAWQQKKYKNNGFFIRGLKGGVVKFFSKEHPEKINHPRLMIETNKQKYTLLATADTFLDSSTTQSLGSQGLLTVSQTQPSMLIFELNKLKSDERVTKAELLMSVKKLYGNSSRVGVFRVDPAPNSSSVEPIVRGLAEKYLLDKNITDDLNVYFATGFEKPDWKEDWKDGGRFGEVVSSDKKTKFIPFLGKALSATLLKGKRTALNQHLRFKDLGVPEPDEAYFRYYIRLGDDWDQTISGGKLPGFAGTYNRAGWGSRKPNGKNGWSARGRFLKTLQVNNTRINPIGSYLYHVDQAGYYGSIWTWEKGEGGLLKNNQWYCIEQFIKLNDINKRNGELKAWVDGRLVFEQKGLRFRLSEELKIEEVWFDFYHGGMALSPQNQTLFMDNLVVSRKYIGPLRKH